MTNLKKLCLATGAMFAFGLTSCGSSAVKYVSSYDPSQSITIDGNHITMCGPYDYGTYEQTGEFTQYNYTTPSGNTFTQLAIFTELTYGDTKQTISETLYFRYDANENLEVLEKENIDLDDIVTFAK